MKFHTFLLAGSLALMTSVPVSGGFTPFDPNEASKAVPRYFLTGGVEDSLSQEALSSTFSQAMALVVALLPTILSAQFSKVISHIYDAGYFVDVVAPALLLGRETIGDPARCEGQRLDYSASLRHHYFSSPPQQPFQADREFSRRPFIGSLRGSSETFTTSGGVYSL